MYPQTFLCPTKIFSCFLRRCLLVLLCGRFVLSMKVSPGVPLLLAFPSPVPGFALQRSRATLPVFRRCSLGDFVRQDEASRWCLSLIIDSTVFRPLTVLLKMRIFLNKFVSAYRVFLTVYRGQLGINIHSTIVYSLSIERSNILLLDAVQSCM